MADLDRPLSVLVHPPLAEPPGMDELERRAHALRRRGQVRKGGLAAAAALALIAGTVTLIPGDKPQTVRTAAPPSGRAAGVSPASPPAGAEAITVLLRTFEVGGQEWRILATRTAEPAICFTIQSRAGEEIKPGCLTPDSRMVQAAAADLEAASFVYGIVATDVTAVSIVVDGNTSQLDLLARGSGFPVHFIGTVVPPTAGSAEVIAISERGEPVGVTVALPVHRRIASVNGEQVTVTTTVVAPAAPAPDRSTPTQPTTTLAPDTPVSTIAPPPPTTVPPPGGGSPKRVTVTPGATQLRKHVFESAAAGESAGFGAHSVVVRFWDGVEPCSVLGRVDVVETADTVTITLWTGIGPGAEAMACIAIAQYKETIVALSAPLGSRTIVDGAA